MRPVQYKWCLLIGFALLYLLPLGWHPLWMPDETRYAEISREMVTSGNWIVPHFMGMQYFEKPIFGYWMNNISQLIFGFNDFAARLAPALSVGLAGLITYRFVLAALNDERKAFYSTLVYMSSPLVFGIGTYNTLDSQLTLWMAACFASFYYAMNGKTRSALAWRYILFGAFGGIAFMTKGFVGLAILVIAIVPFMVVTRQFKQVFFYGILSVLAAIVVALPWSLAVAAKAPDYWNFFFWNENIRRFEAKNAQHLAPIWYYIPVLIAAIFPWTVVAPKAIKKSFTESANKRFFLYQAFCFILPFILLSIAKGKLATYIMPLMMPLAIMIGCGLVDLLNEKSRVLKVAVWVNGVVFALLAVALAAVQFSGKTQGYTPDDMHRFWLAIVLFAGCALVPFISLSKPLNTPKFLAAVPVALLIFLPSVLPMMVVNSKQPEAFFRQHVSQIQPDAWVLSNSVSLIGGIGWVLQRSDIDLLNVAGELQYGIDHSDKKRHYTIDEFKAALAEKRQHQQVVVTFKVDHSGAAELVDIPTPSTQFHAGRYFLYIYDKAQ